MTDVRARLAAPDLALQVARLGFREDDQAAALAAARAVLESGDELARVATMVTGLRAALGDFTFGDPDPWQDPGAETSRLGVGVLPLLALLVTAPEVAAFHRRRGISEDVSWGSLADLGQQAWVHRQTYGEFGLHTYPWLRIAWSGALYWLGRLQFNLQLTDGEWVLSTHIPAVGPLTPTAVDESMCQARDFFARHFPDYPTSDFYCSSWLLDPELAAALAPASNLASFQRRWRLYGEPMRGDSDVLFFTFFRRRPVDLATLPRQTSLQRAVVARLESGRHWHVWQGRISQSAVGSASALGQAPALDAPGTKQASPGAGSTGSAAVEVSR